MNKILAKGGVASNYNMWSWQYSFTMQDTRYDVFRHNYFDRREQVWKEAHWCYVERHKDDPQNHDVGAADVTYPFQGYPNLGEALRALGWEGQRLKWWLHVPPSVQWDWEDLTQEELLEKGAPSPIISIASECESDDKEKEDEGLYDPYNSAIEATGYVRG